MVIIILGYALGFIYITTASWPLYIDLVIFGLTLLLSVPVLIAMKKDLDCTGVMMYKAVAGAMSTGVIFIILFLWGNLSLSIWWYIVALIVGILVSFIPGGVTLSVFLLKKIGVYFVMSPWLLPLSIALDVISLAIFFIGLSRKNY